MRVCILLLALSALGCATIKPAQTMQRLRGPVVALLEIRVAQLAATDPQAARQVITRAAFALTVLQDAKHALAAGDLTGDHRRVWVQAVKKNAGILAELLPGGPPWLKAALAVAVQLTPAQPPGQVAEVFGGLELSHTNYQAWAAHLFRVHGL